MVLMYRRRLSRKRTAASLEAADEARGHYRAAQFAAYRTEGNDWPGHKDCDF
jgi:hypothetical protein